MSGLPGRSRPARPARHGASSWLACAAVAAELTVGANLLTLLGSRYVSDGGFLAEKLHPGSYLAVAAACAAVLARGRRAGGLLWRQLPLSFFMLCMSGAALWAGLFSGAGNLIVLFDNFLAAGCLGLAMAEVPDAARNRLRVLLQVGFALNAALAIGEAVAGSHLLPLYLNGAPATELAADFRPIALYDHPLTGATATLIGLFLAPGPGRPVLRRGYILLLGAALLAFGSRAALAVGILAGAWSVAQPWATALLQRRRGAGWALAALALLPLAVALTVGAAWASGVGERVWQHGFWDASAQSRLLQWRILDGLDARELLFGAPRAALLDQLNMLRLDSGVDVIESFALLMFVTLGAGGFPIFLAGFIALLAWCWGRAGGPGRRLVLCFSVAILASNSLGRKSVLLLLLVASVTALPRTVPDASCA